MLKVIRTKSDISELKSTLEKLTSYCIPYFCEPNAHLAFNKPSVLFIFVPEINITFIFSVDHNEGENIKLKYIQDIVPYNMWVPSKKEMLYLEIFEGCRDFEALKYSHQDLTNMVERKSPLIKEFNTKFWNYRNVNKSIPMMKLLEHADQYFAEMQEYTHPAVETHYFDFLNRYAIPAYHFIEKSGLKIDPKKYIEIFGEKSEKNIVDDMVYSEYNPFTSTSRPSNAAGGVNYASLNKHDNTREAFISRFDDGELILIDFESFHLRLIAKLIGFPQPKEPFHTYMARQYFDVAEITPELYEQGKKLTFFHLYGDNRNINVDFFNKVYQYIDNLWETAQKDGYFTTPWGHQFWLKDMDSPSKSKVFNYLIQATESETTGYVFYTLFYDQQVFAGKRSKPILYTYDSLLIDYCKDDGDGLLEQIRGILESDGEYPTRMYRGKDYKNLTKI